MVKRKWSNGRKMIYKTLSRKLKIEQHELHNKNPPKKPKKQGMNSDYPEG
jgi:hypothetical protein